VSVCSLELAAPPRDERVLLETVVRAYLPAADGRRRVSARRPKRAPAMARCSRIRLSNRNELKSVDAIPVGYGLARKQVPRSRWSRTSYSPISGSGACTLTAKSRTDAAVSAGSCRATGSTNQQASRRGRQAEPTLLLLRGPALKQKSRSQACSGDGAEASQLAQTPVLIASERAPSRDEKRLTSRYVPARWEQLQATPARLARRRSCRLHPTSRTVAGQTDLSSSPMAPDPRGMLRGPRDDRTDRPGVGARRPAPAHAPI